MIIKITFYFIHREIYNKSFVQYTLCGEHARLKLAKNLTKTTSSLVKLTKTKLK